MFSCEFCEISRNTFFTEHHWATASAFQTSQAVIWRYSQRSLLRFTGKCLWSRPSLVILNVYVGASLCSFIVTQSFSHLRHYQNCSTIAFSYNRAKLLHCGNFPLDTGCKLNVHKTFDVLDVF